jgi:hypothetical protein
MIPTEASEWNLYRVAAKVRPLPWHPKYYDWQFGFLRIWLFANSVEDAVDRARKISDELPYERIGDEFGVGTTEKTAETEDGSPQESARATGLAIRLLGVETGADESAFESIPPM